MERYDRDKYYHGGLGTGNRKDWDRSSRDGDFGRDYENRFRTDRDRNEEYRRRNHEMNDNYYSNTHGEDDNLSTIRQGYGIAGFGNEGRFTDTGEDIAQRMRRDRERLHDQGYGSGRTSGYSGSAFGGSNYSAHGDFGGSSRYGSMSGGEGNVEDYVSMSGYGGGRGARSQHFDRENSDYTSESYRENYGDKGLESRMRITDFERTTNVGRYSPDNQRSLYTSFSDIRHKDRDNNYYRNPDRGAMMIMIPTTGGTPDKLYRKVSCKAGLFI
ncbi:hypothetical protein [Pontibacter pudoricolor]|uniref:hypothetical protein n=1 Tax=Pontibacter pudoricolor TaxID=2694930 RepID=UPI00139125B8|nr:hypothetical protein [Pontibacter pudoricolor]